MGAPESGMKAADRPTADGLLTAFRTIKDPERHKHVQVLDYWLSIRGDKEFPPLHDLDPLEISDAAPFSLLLELIGGGQDAEIRHLGAELKNDVTVQRIIDASNPSLLSSIARKLPIVAISRDFLSFEDNFTNADGLTRCWITLLPLSSCGSWVDYVYAFVSLEKGATKVAAKVEELPVEPVEDVAASVEEAAVEAAAAEEAAVEEVVAGEPEPAAEAPAEEPEPAVEEPVAEEIAEPVEALEEEPAVEEAGPEEALVELEPQPEPEPEPEPEPQAELSAEEPAAELESEPDPLPAFLTEEPPPAKSSPGFSKILEGLSQLTGFYGQGVKVDDPVIPMELASSEPADSELPSTEPEVPVSAEEPLELEDVAAAPEPETAEAAPEPETAEAPAEPVATEEQPLDIETPAPALEGTLQSKLTEVQAKADEAREAQVRATAALHEGLSAAYDFALDAETAPEEYLKLVEAQGMKIQLRAPMAPVAKLAFDGVCDAATIRQFEAVLAWALKVELPRGALLERIQSAGGIPQLLDEFSKAA